MFPFDLLNFYLLKMLYLENIWKWSIKTHNFKISQAEMQAASIMFLWLHASVDIYSTYRVVFDEFTFVKWHEWRRECIRSCLLRAVAAKEISMTKLWPGQIFIRSVYKYQRARLYLLALHKDLQTSEENIEFHATTHRRRGAKHNIC